MSEAVGKLTEVLKNQPETPLRPHQVEAYHEEARRLQAIVQAPPYVTGINRGLAAKKSREVEKSIVTQTPQPVSGREQDEIAKLAKQVMEEDIRPAMLTKEEMHRNPAGAVGTYMKQERHPLTTAAIRLWKRAMFTLEPLSKDPDLANIERFRPEKMRTETSTHMVGAQLPGVHAMPESAKANLPPEMQVVPPSSALGQIQARDARHRLTNKKKIT